MSELSPGLSELLAGMIPRIAVRVARTYRHVPAEDLEQEMWLHALSTGERLQRFYDAGDRERAIWDEMKRGARKLVKEDERFRRAQKAAAEGYSTLDEQFYTIGMLQALLPLYFEGGVTEEPPKGRASRGAPGGQSEGGNYLAMMIDLDLGLAAVAVGHQRLLERYFRLPQGDDEASRWTRQQEASSMGLTYDALRMRVYRALAALRHELGGANPWNRAPAEYELPDERSTGRTNPGQPTASQRQKLVSKR